MAHRTARGAYLLAKLAGGASLSALMMAPAYAQDAGAAPDDADAIVVTGIRASLEQAADIKREAPQVMDVITAEDVGKLPDANVAEALQRVTGVQITRVFGEGQSVSVRGLQQVRVEVDGRTLLGWSARLSPPENDQLGRSSGLDSVPFQPVRPSRSAQIAARQPRPKAASAARSTSSRRSRCRSRNRRSRSVRRASIRKIRTSSNPRSPVSRRPNSPTAGSASCSRANIEAHVDDADVRAQQFPQSQLYRRWRRGDPDPDAAAI